MILHQDIFLNFKITPLFSTGGFFFEKIFGDMKYVLYLCQKYYKNNNYEDYKIKDVKDWGDLKGFQMFIAEI